VIARLPDGDREDLRLCPLEREDLPAVAAIERRAYVCGWTEGIFRDCLRAGYVCEGLWRGRTLVGYGVLLLGMEEAHLLNICVDPPYQGVGYGRLLLEHFVERSRRAGTVRHMILEVRVSNVRARALYLSSGFRPIGVRRGYYPGEHDAAREDALVLLLEFRDDPAPPASSEGLSKERGV
jgi:ribosomal-protein-alanine N-acetyltransferase